MVSASSLKILSWTYSKEASHSLHFFINPATVEGISDPSVTIRVTFIFLCDLQ